MEKKIIFIFLGGYLPAKKYGGPVTSIVNLVDNLKHKYDFYIVSNNHELDEFGVLDGINSGWNDVRGARVLYLPEKQFNTENFINILKDFRVSLVYLSSVFYYKMNLPAVKAANILNIPILLAPRGETCNGALEIKKLKKTLYLIFIKIFNYFKGVAFHTTSIEEKESIIDIFNVNEKKIFLLPNMHGAKLEKKEFNKKKNSLRIVFISRIQEKKNLLYAIDTVSKLSGDIIFDIYGPIEQLAYWEKCEKEINNLKEKKNITINYRGSLEPNTSKEIFIQYDCFFFPTLSENYGHVIAEALLSNCPCVISKDTTPWNDLHERGGFIAPLDNQKEFIKILNNIAEMNIEEYKDLCDLTNQYAEQTFEHKELANDYDTMFNNIMECK